MSVLTLAACQNNDYKITGTADAKMEGQTAYLISANTNEAIDSCVVTSNTFSFNGKMETPQILRTQIGRRSNIILAEPGSRINVDFTVTGPGQQAVTDNGRANTRKNEFMQSLNATLQERQATYEQMMREGKPTEEIKEFNTRFKKELNDIYKKCIEENKDNILGAFIFVNTAANTYNNVAALDSAIAAVKYAADIKQVQEIRNSLYSLEATKEGKPFADFKGKGIDGKECSLSDYVGKGKFILVDFWASWCSPCRAEIPNLIAANKEFGGEKFAVLGVNVWDSEQKFHESLKSEGIDYAQIFVPRDANATKLYGIQSIPQIMLIGPDGTILKRNLRGEAIRAAIEEALK